MSASPVSSLSKSTIVAAGAGLAASAFVAYCVYYDHKRRSAPDFKRKLREKRAEKRRKAAESASSRRAGGGGAQPLPNFNNPTEMQAFFLQEVQLGEELLAEGDVDNGVEHLCNAITMCGQPQQLLQILQQTLPAQVFAQLMQKLPQVGTRLARRAAESEMAGGDTDGAQIIPDAELE